MRQITGIVSTMLMLIALYLVLSRGANATKIIGAIATGGAKVFRTLQGHPVRGV
jgi:hypothetical protein